MLNACVCLLSTDINSQNTWLLFLPYFHLKAKTSVFMTITVLVLVLDLISLLMIGQLFIFHLYLSTQPRPRTPTPSASPGWPVLPLMFTCDLRQVAAPLTRNKLLPKGQTFTLRGSRASPVPRTAENRKD